MSNVLFKRFTGPRSGLYLCGTCNLEWESEDPLSHCPKCTELAGGRASQLVGSSHMKAGPAEDLLNAGGPPARGQTNVDSTLKERGSRYGKFINHSATTQDLKLVMHQSPNWAWLEVDMKEALEMIQHKIGRILNGDPSYGDSWHDIQGYAKLVEDRLNGKVV